MHAKSNAVAKLTCFLFELLAVPPRLPVADLAEPRTDDVRVRLAPENFMHLMSKNTVARTQVRTWLPFNFQWPSQQRVAKGIARSQ